MAHGPLLTALANPAVSLTLGSVALLGPGRPLIRDGLTSLARCGAGCRKKAPNAAGI